MSNDKGIFGIVSEKSQNPDSDNPFTRIENTLNNIDNRVRRLEYVIYGTIISAVVLRFVFVDIGLVILKLLLGDLDIDINMSPKKEE